MKNEIDVFAYMMASEKMINLINVLEQTLDFFEEYKIKPDAEVVNTLQPILDKYADWIKTK